jgi:integrase
VKREVIWKSEWGSGTVFYRLDKNGKRVCENLSLSYRDGGGALGREIVVSAKTNNLADAKRELKRRTRNVANAAEGKETLVVPKMERVTIADLLDGNLVRARAKRLADIEGVERRTEILRRLLGHVRAVDYRPEHTDEYRKKREAGQGSKRGAKVGPMGVRRELEVLETAFRYAVKRRVLAIRPEIEKPSGTNVREVEIPLGEFPRILAALAVISAHISDFVEWLLLTAMRPGAVRAFRWEWFDQKAWTLSVPSHKRGVAREFSIEGTLRKVIERRIARRRLDCPFIFHDGEGQALDARRVRKVFYRALTACGLPTGKAGYTLYDTKKTAVGLLLDAGLSDAEAMDFSGHRTASMLQRYRTKTAKRHGASVRKRDEYLASLGVADSPAVSADSLPN